MFVHRCACVWEWYFFLAIYCTSLTSGAVCCIFWKSGRHIRFHYNAKSLFSMPFKIYTYTHTYIFQFTNSICICMSTHLIHSFYFVVVAIFAQLQKHKHFKSWRFFFRFSNFSFKLIFFCCSFRWRILTLKLTNNLECIWNNKT